MNETLSASDFLSNLQPPFTTVNAPSSLQQTQRHSQPNSYFRPLSFMHRFGINPLIAAASTLLMINHQVKHASHLDSNPSNPPGDNLTQLDDLASLQQKLRHEIQAFESHAREQGYSSETLILARYVLCATLDESLSQHHSHQLSTQQQDSLLQFFHQETIADERLFVIIERLMEQIPQHLDLLELVFLCLNLGLKGKYRHGTDDIEQLQQFIDNLYENLCLYREEPKPLLCSTKPVDLSTALPDSKHKPFLLKTLTTTLSSCLLIYVGFSVLMYTVTTPIQIQLAQLEQTTHLTPLQQKATPLAPIQAQTLRESGGPGDASLP